MKPKNDFHPQAADKWIEKAKHDIDTAFLNHHYAGYTDVTCYFAHQTVEKSLKAFLIYHSIRFKKIHHLPKLLVMCIGKEQRFTEFDETCQTLNDYYVETKYPMDISVVYTKEEAEEAINLAQEIYDFVKERVTA